MNGGPRAAASVRVSVIVTAYNHEAYIGRALEGILKQTGVSFELLVGDDCSTDGTRSVIDSYVHRNPDLIRVHYPEENLGGGGKVIFDELIRRSQGEYIAGLDGDDYWTSPTKLLVQTAYLDEHPECSMVFHNVVRHFEDDERPDELYLSQGGRRQLEWRDLFGSNPVPACSPLFRRAALDPLPAWYFHLPWGDWPLYFMAMEKGEVHYLPDVMGVFRLHGRGMHSGLSDVARRENEVEFFSRLVGVLPPPQEEHLRRRLALALSRLARAQLRAGRRDAARVRLAESFRTWPLDPRLLLRGQGERARLALWALTRLPLQPPVRPVEDVR
ncbi:glycosyltransferase [Geodermatophilus sabuli]|uniref:Glycosyltransferase involved in cell wall bisynthesis n=1 Tax=Geodermatophilus sabuli TaxID=1564158 RepID=A0A285EIR1_9ACTN|nr:glycosyltransferase [Geodermatophilus sabuli]MBB3086883.1 glycosyltransferase involved in cell wall biosynthesis [Geodermatophilus sabuli]SNX98743.1 Glycosyltransferase involved in cell wall bisynthesis [Geodermatophilus sabuli]